MVARPISIKGTGCKSGGCVRKAVELTSGDLPLVPDTGLRVERSILGAAEVSSESTSGLRFARTTAISASAVGGFGHGAAEAQGEPAEKCGGKERFGT